MNCHIQTVLASTLLTEHNLGVLFLVETDTNSIIEEKYYKIIGYNTIILQAKEKITDKTKIVCLINSEKVEKQEIKLRPDLMSSKFPSIWIEIEREYERNILACGFYREWSIDGQKITSHNWMQLT